MLIVMTSPAAILSKGVPDPSIANVLIAAKAANNPVGLISNHTEPAWFAKTFGQSGVQFIRSMGRQSGEIVCVNSNKFSLNPFDVLVLAAKDEDVQMGKNGGAVLVAAGWAAASPQVKALGIRVDSAAQLQEVINLVSGWSGHWWYSGKASWYGVRALADLSTYDKGITQEIFGGKLKATVKGGGSRLNALLAVTSRSLLIDGFGTAADLVWGVYPSSASKNDDSEVLSDFTHRLRTTVSRVQMAKRGEPLFIRHTPSVKRSAGGGGDRTDPSGQVMTLHLNPFYSKKKRLVGKHVIVVDDCTTYGVSFGVAAGLLRAAGASSVTGIALGKFGSQLRHYEIHISADPFAPIPKNGFKVVKVGGFSGEINAPAQQALQSLIP